MSELDPALDDALHDRYRDRPKQLAEVLANAEAWERLKTIKPPITTEGADHAAGHR